jgi:hypothetical protein
MTDQLYHTSNLKLAVGKKQLAIADCPLLPIIIGTDFYYSVNTELTRHQYYSYYFKYKDYE